MLLAAGCAWPRGPITIGKPPLPPPVLPAEPTLQQVIDVVNGSSSKIRTFSTNGATLSGAGLPSLRASVVFERPRRFRLRAETVMTGAELDVGSNDELFWLWIRRNEPRAMYYCRHAQFAASPARQMLPIDPGWLIEALGITELDPGLPHQGPFRVGTDQFAVHTVRETPDGPQTKVTVVDGRRGLVVEQRVYDAAGQLVASAVTSRHRLDPLSDVMVPKVVDINCPRADLTLRIDLGNVEVNRGLDESGEVWAMPRYDGFPPVDLCDPRIYQPPAPPPQTSWRDRTPTARR
jgi:hypothetical protein